MPIQKTITCNTGASGNYIKINDGFRIGVRLFKSKTQSDAGKSSMMSFDFNVSKEDDPDLYNAIATLLYNHIKTMKDLNGVDFTTGTTDV